MSVQTFTPDESIKLIRNMIDKTRREFSDNSIYFLIWGWGAFLGCVGQFLLKAVFEYSHHYRVWFITIVCAILTVIIVVRDNKREKVQTYVGDSMNYVWTGLGIAFTVIGIIFIKIGWQYCFPFYILLYGIGTFVSGRFLNYSPLIIGGVISFILASISAWLPYDYQILCAAGALLASYIIPGHMLRLRYQRSIQIK